MYLEGLRDLVKISRGVGLRQDYIQGGGGNTSVKLDDKLMAIKGSGSLLKEMSETDGFAAIDYSEILKYHANTPKNQDRDYNKESMDIAIATTQIINGEQKRRPSVEAGFHSALKRCVAHTHSVYANVLTCAVGGVKKAVDIINSAGYGCVSVPAVNPGYYLTEEIVAAIKAFDGEVNVIIMENHGIIATHDDADKCLEIHKGANDAIVASLNLPSFPECSIAKAEGGYVSNTPYLIDKMSDVQKLNKLFTVFLYPDQLVYLSNEAKIQRKDNSMLYTVGEQEAMAIEETLCGAMYCMENIHALGLTIQPMTDENIKYIANWDSEKLRTQIFKK